MKFFAVARAAMLCLCLDAFATDPPSGTERLVEPGTWAVLPQNASGTSLSYQVCFKSGSFDDLKLLLPSIAAAAGCPQPDVKLERNQLQWRLVCPARALTVDASYKWTLERIEGVVTSSGSDAASNSTQAIAAHRVGQCPS